MKPESSTARLESCRSSNKCGTCYMVGGLLGIAAKQFLATKTGLCSILLLGETLQTICRKGCGNRAKLDICKTDNTPHASHC